MPQLVPFTPDMQRGQGFNTFLQEPCVRGAVTVTSSGFECKQFKADYESSLIESYEKLVQSLDISAGAAVSGWGQSAKVDAKYLDRTEFENSTPTYQVRVSVQQQGSVDNVYNFNKLNSGNLASTYGDRFIADFIRGGLFLARVSITVKNTSSKKEISEAAEVAFNAYGAEGKVTEDVKSAVEKIQKNSHVSIKIHEMTGTQSEGGPTTKTEAAGSDLLAVKARADKFYDDAHAGKHTHIRFAMLSQYTRLPDFDQSWFVPLDYSKANLLSWSLLDDFTKYLATEKIVKQIPLEKFKQGLLQKQELERQRIEEVDKIKQRALDISKKPDTATAPPTHTRPETFRFQVYEAIKTVIYIVQSIPKPDDNWTDTIDKYLASGAKQRFKIQVYDFDQVLGTTVVSFGKHRRSDEYHCLIGERLQNYNDWKEESHFWVFPEAIHGVADTAILAYGTRAKRYLRLQEGDPSDLSQVSGRPFFYFHTAFDPAAGSY
ncbi:uncharacterized protein CIMG_06183 [Coccidioides immitis RS]|uniref:MACPF domain-containing protein n=1 Tax=Coccidioides immitis (strain RS) TaxID=246410 RepID=J3K7L5_COCIM|nr:uncharacterized protein CIMG_06183 [Coccidioides immitis RS]EAS30704.3 hypothetical protein CIMG_06183 [Coccidioides immitis RS]